MRTGYWLQNEFIYGPAGYTGYRVYQGRIFGHAGDTRYSIRNDRVYLRNVGVTGYAIEGTFIVGPSDRLPWMQAQPSHEPHA